MKARWIGDWAPDAVKKANSNHDERGRFATVGGGQGEEVTVDTGSTKQMSDHMLERHADAHGGNLLTRNIDKLNQWHDRLHETSANHVHTRDAVLPPY